MRDSDTAGILRLECEAAKLPDGIDRVANKYRQTSAFPVGQGGPVESLGPGSARVGRAITPTVPSTS